MADKEHLQHLLANEESITGGDYGNHDGCHRKTGKPWRNGSSSKYAVFLVLSLGLNVVLLACLGKIYFVEAQRGQAMMPLEYLSTKASPYSGLPHDTQVPYAHDTDYISKNRTLADELWSKVDNVFAIAVPEEWARQKGLPHSWKFPWDLEKRIYFPKVGHQLHCLKSMRAAYHELWERNETRFTHGHLEHCLDSLRQDLMCQADDTPMPALKPLYGVGDDQVMQCKNFEKLRQWIYSPERHACYHHINMFKGVRHPIERFAFCPEDSIYHPVMKKYFDVHGHLETIEDMG